MNKKIIVDYMNEVWNKKNVSIINTVFSNTAVIHSPLGEYTNSREMEATVRNWLTAIPDMHVSLLHTVEENDMVVSHWVAKGTHQKELNGIPPKGNEIEYQGITMYKMENGKVVEYWSYVDSWAILKQMTGM